MKRKPKGRPKKKHGRKSDQIVVRVTPEKKAEYERAAEAAGMDVADWVRATLDESIWRADPEFHRYLREMERAFEIMRRKKVPPAESDQD